MTRSMTGFARQEIQNDWGDLVWEVRSINHRFLDMSVRLPETFRHLEGDLRSKVKAKLSRGKVDLTLNYQAGPALVTDIVINQPLVEQLAKACQQLSQTIENVGTVDPMRLLKWPGVTRFSEADLGDVEERVLTALDDALSKLIETREKEGVALKILILDRIEIAQKEIAKVETQIPLISQALRDKLTDKLKEIEVSFDQSRLEQELVIQLQKTDVAEEIDRLQTHLKEVSDVINKGGVMGRRLDFLMQELLREANTLGSKTLDALVTSTVVELKVLIEQMREQVQNIE